MNCAYHSHINAVVSCNGCGKPLCTACDHRIKGFPYCQDCIVQGVELLRHQSRSDHSPFVKNRTSPAAATLLSLICPGLGAIYNGQPTKALVHFAVFVGLFQLAIIMRGMPLFVFGFIGIWLFAALDSWRTAQMIRSGVTPDVAEDILVKRFSGNPVFWGLVLAALGAIFLLQKLFFVGPAIRILLPIALIGFGIYLLKGYVFKSAKTDESDAGAPTSPDFAAANSYYYNDRPMNGEPDSVNAPRFGAWRDK